MNRLYFIDGRYLGKAPIPSQVAAPHPILWVCHTCGDTYAKLPTEGCPALRWWVYIGCCEKCKPIPPAIGQLGVVVPGSIWSQQMSILHDTSPEFIVKRELKLTLNAYERGEL